MELIRWAAAACDFILFNLLNTAFFKVYFGLVFPCNIWQHSLFRPCGLVSECNCGTRQTCVEICKQVKILILKD